MKQNCKILIDELIVDCNSIVNQSLKLKQFPVFALDAKYNADSWSVFECIEHMNRYGDYYLQEIENKINSSKHKAEEDYKSGWLGEFAVKSMLPKKNGATNWPMKTFPEMNPAGIKGDVLIIDKFISQLKTMIELLEKSRAVGLRKTRCTLTLKWMKFSLGDTLRFMVNHNKRHMLQVDKILASHEKVKFNIS